MRVFLVFLLLIAFGVPLAAQDEPSAYLSIGPRVNITPDKPGWLQDEFSADADPNNPGRMIYCIRAFDPSTDSIRGGAYVSFDNGKTWAHTLDAGRAPNFGYSDPACTYGLHGEVYVAELSVDTNRPLPKSLWRTWPYESDYPQRMDFYRSFDGGKHWEPAKHLGFIDHETIVVDRTNSSYRGRIYIYGNPSDWNRSKQNIMWMLYSTDGGMTFVRSAPRRVAHGWHHYGKGALLLDGTLLIPYMQKALAGATKVEATGLAVTATNDGGAHLSSLMTVTSTAQLCGLPYMAADTSNGPFRGRAYIIWQQFERGYWNDLPASCTLMLAYSDNDGKNWSDPIRVSDFYRRNTNSKGPDVLSPAIAVNKYGVVATNWSDTRDDPQNMSTVQRVSASFDGGQTWVPSVPLPGAYSELKGLEGGQVEMMVTGGGSTMSALLPGAPPQTLHTEAYDAGHGGGDYTIFVTDPNGTFHALWSDNGGKASGAIPMYVAPVSAHGKVYRNGSPLLDGLKDVTPQLELQYVEDTSTWTPDTYSLSLHYLLHNTSNKTISGPLRLRFVAMASPIGPESLVFDDGATGGIGSIIDLTSTLPGGALSPGQKTKVRHFTLRINHYNHTIAQSWAVRPNLVTFDTRIFGKILSH